MDIDWNGVFVPFLGFAEIVLRGSIMYLGLFVVLLEGGPEPLDRPISW